MTDERAALIAALLGYTGRAATTVHAPIVDARAAMRAAAAMLASDAAKIARLSEEARALREALEPFANAWNDEMFLWSRDDLQRFMAEGISMSNPRYGDNTPVYCVIESGEDHEDRSDDYLFTVGDLRRAALARANGEAK